MALLLVVQWWMRDLTGKPGSTFSKNRAAQTLEYRRVMTLLRIVIQLHLSCLSMVFSGKPVSAFPIMLRGRFPQKGSPAKGPGTPCALRRNIFRKRQKTMVCLAFG
jgi:hypothetical protein